jgi:methylenetetrahydrofolate dehydrogenase (NADP+)/methenyltetrahydrofolate cyclohydrolase
MYDGGVYLSARILEGKVFAGQFKEDARKRAAALKEKYGVQPGLAVIIVGHDPASEVYVRNKHKACEGLGIYSEVIEMPEESTKEEILARIDSLNKDSKIHGILVQLPLPKALRPAEAEILDSIDPVKDVDGFHPVNVGRMVKGEEALLPCTPHGCLKMLELAGIPLEGKKAVVVGRSNIVGKPMLHLLLAKNATVTVCLPAQRICLPLPGRQISWWQPWAVPGSSPPRW